MVFKTARGKKKTKKIGVVNSGFRKKFREGGASAHILRGGGNLQRGKVALTDDWGGGKKGRRFVHSRGRGTGRFQGKRGEKNSSGCGEGRTKGGKEREEMEEK